MHDETPEIDYTRFESIKSYFNVFENKLSQAGPLLITLHKPTNLIPSTKELNPNAMMDELSTVPTSGVKKYAKSASFPSNHSRTVYVMCKLPERKIITGSDDGSINMFDMTTFESIGSYQCHVGGIRCMITLPNAKLITGSYDKTIKIWPDPLKIGDLSQSNLQLSQVSQFSKKSTSNNLMSALKTLTGHTSSVISLKYLNDGENFASGSADYNIKVWNYERGENVKNFSGHMSDILCMDCTSNGHTLISGSADRTIKVWSLTKKYSSACLKTLTGHLDFIWTIVLLQDDATLLSGGIDKGIKMWDIHTGNLIRNLPVEHTSHITKIIQLTK
jgi:WD40 repeat protein